MRPTLFHSARARGLHWLAVAALAAAPAFLHAAHAATFSAKLSGAAEVPANSTTGSGNADVTLDESSKLLRWSVNYSGLTGPATAGHIHGPALPGGNAGVVVPFKGSVDSPVKGEATLTDAQIADLKDGKWYVNIHTAANPGGEIRGQLMPVK